MDVLGTVINVVLLLATLAVVWFAWRTVKESRKATTAAQDTTNELKTLVTAARETASSSAQALEMARDTAASSRQAADAALETTTIAKAARDADERYRQLEQLRAVLRLVQAIGVEAQNQIIDYELGPPNPTPAEMTWRSAQQDQLGSTLVGVVPPLPKCRALVEEQGTILVRYSAEKAEAELQGVFRSLGAEGG